MNALNNSETILARMMEILEEGSAQNKVEAALIFCAESEIDLEEFLTLIDDNIKEQLKEEAVDKYLVRRKISGKHATLPI